MAKAEFCTLCSILVGETQTTARPCEGFQFCPRGTCWLSSPEEPRGCLCSCFSPRTSPAPTEQRQSGDIFPTQGKTSLPRCRSGALAGQIPSTFPVQRHCLDSLQCGNFAPGDSSDPDLARCTPEAPSRAVSTTTCLSLLSHNSV